MDAEVEQRDSAEDPPRIYRINRRGFLWQVAAACAGGVGLLDAVARAPERPSERSTYSTNRKRLGLFSLYLEHRPFRTSCVEVYPVLEDQDSRLLGLSQTGWLGIWALDEPHKPRFKGEGSCCPPAPLADRDTAGEVTAAAESEDGSARAESQPLQAELTVQRRDRSPMRVALDPRRGAIEALGLGRDGSGLAVAMSRGGILLFDLRGEQPKFLGEYYDDNIALDHIGTAQGEGPWSFLPCACDTVQAQGDGDSVTVSQSESSAFSRYDSVTGKLSSWTQPCGTAVPAGAVCICNCVRAPALTVARDYCLCDRVCTCNLVSTKPCACDKVRSKKHCSCDKVCTCNLVYY